jgi:hypothetical protein
MKTHQIGIIMNGVTGRMGTNQHLIRSIKAIIDQGGVKLSDSERSSCPIRSSSAAARRSSRPSPRAPASARLDQPRRRARESRQPDLLRRHPDRPAPVGVRKAIAAKKHIYCEKPTATTSQEALALAREVTAAG